MTTDVSRARRRTWLGLVCLATLVAAGGNQAAEQWTYAASEHFEVYTTGGDKRARESLAYFERIHAFFEDFMKLSPKQATPTRLVVFSNAREYKPYRFSEWATAYYLGGPDRDYIVMQSLDAESYPLVVHEYAHLIFKHSGAVYPRWLNEGLAEFFSTITPEGGKMSLGKVSLGRLRAVNEERLMELGRLFSVDLQSAEYRSRDHAGLFYAQSWALTHMIMAGDGYRPKSGAFLTAVGNGTPSAAAFQSIYGKTPAEVLSDLGTYIRNDRFLFFSANYRDPKGSRAFPTRTVDAFEGGLVTANLLAAQTEHQDSARAAYEKLAVLRPDDLALAEARAQFTLNHGDRTAAEPFVRKAIALGSRNSRLYHLAATFADSAAERSAFLEKALGFDPDDLDIRLAYVADLTRNRDSARALAALNAIERIPADQAFMVFQLRANLLAQLDRIDEAQAAARKAREYASPGSSAEYADTLIASLDAFARRRAEAGRLIREANAAGLDTLATPAAAPAPADALRPAAISGPDPIENLITMSTGRIRNLICGTNTPTIEIATADGLVRLLIDDPVRIRILGAAGPTTDLACGGQDRAARFGYQPGVDAARKTVGVLRLLDFR